MAFSYFNAALKLRFGVLVNFNIFFLSSSLFVQFEEALMS